MYSVRPRSGARHGETPRIGGNPKNQPISELDIFSKRQALSRAVVVNGNMSRGKYLAREGPGSRLENTITRSRLLLVMATALQCDSWELTVFTKGKNGCRVPPVRWHLQSEWKIRVRRLLAQIVKMNKLFLPNQPREACVKSISTPKNCFYEIKSAEGLEQRRNIRWCSHLPCLSRWTTRRESKCSA